MGDVEEHPRDARELLHVQVRGFVAQAVVVRVRQGGEEEDGDAGHHERRVVAPAEPLQLRVRPRGEGGE